MKDLINILVIIILSFFAVGLTVITMSGQFTTELAVVLYLIIALFMFLWGLKLYFDYTNVPEKEPENTDNKTLDV